MHRLLPVIVLVLGLSAGWWAGLLEGTEPAPPPSTSTSDGGASWDPWGG